jgi:peptide/nickel transport system permease protein
MSTGAHRSTGSDAVQLSARQVAWRRRRDSLTRSWREFCRHKTGLVGLCVLILFALVAIFAPLLASSDGLEVTKATGLPLQGPSSSFWLGTDESGRSVLTLLIYGSRVSLFVGLAATLISMILGTLIGIASGHFTGIVGTLLFRLTEWFLVIPFLPLALVLATLLGPSLLTICFVIGVTSWPGTALLIRSQTLSIEARPYMERARVLGAGNWHQMTRHVLPNVMPMVFANTTLTVAIAILSETTLSFLGLGDPTRVSWGTMLDSAFENGAMTLGAWWFLFPPGICVVVVVLSFTVAGQALEEIFNPRLRDR